MLVRGVRRKCRCLEDLEVYQVSMAIGETVWAIVSEWDHFAKRVIGEQFVRAADSIAANLSEGYGRYHYNENRHFCYYARGSLLETRTWLTKAYRRGLISEECHEALSADLESLSVRLNNYIRSIGRQAADTEE